MSEVAHLIPEKHPLTMLSLQDEEELMFLGTAPICHLITSWHEQGMPMSDPIIARLDALYTYSDAKPQLSMLRTYGDFSLRGAGLYVHQGGQWQRGTLDHSLQGHEENVSVALPAAEPLLTFPITSPEVLLCTDANYLRQHPDFAGQWARGIDPSYAGFTAGQFFVALQTLPEEA